MATSTYLSNPVVTVNSVDISDQCKGANISVAYDPLENTAFGDQASKANWRPARLPSTVAPSRGRKRDLPLTRKARHETHTSV